MPKPFLWVGILAHASLQIEGVCTNNEVEDHAVPLDVGQRSLIQGGKPHPLAGQLAGQLANSSEGTTGGDQSPTQQGISHLRLWESDTRSTSANKELVQYDFSEDDSSQSTPDKRCNHLWTRHYTSGAFANLDDAGYQETAKLCCHFEMSLFIKREIAAQDYEVCSLPDLHGFVHWYDCNNDNKTFSELQKEIEASSRGNCPWLGLATCPQRGANCKDFTPCAKEYPAGSKSGAAASLDAAGYEKVRKTCCHVEMEHFVLRYIEQQNLEVCNEGGLQGFLHWYDCTDDGPGQGFGYMKKQIEDAAGKHPDEQSCPWLKEKGKKCPKLGHNCPWIETGPNAHRRRFCNQPLGAPLSAP